MNALAAPSFREALAVWWRIGCLSFGGPAGQIALMHRILVEEKGWIDEKRFLGALNYCMLLPGPEAQQLATYVGWMLHGVRGGLVAGLLFILPGAAVILALSFAYVHFADLPLVDGILFGIKAAVVVIVIQALLRIAQRALSGARDWLLALGGFTALYVFNAPFPLVILAAAAVGLLTPAVAGQLPLAAATRLGNVRSTLVAAACCALAWIGIVLTLHLALGTDNVFSQIAGFFSVVAVVTFGGAYAVLSYIAQQCVEVYGWLSASEMLDGLGLAESTPGPLILVTQFVGFLGAARAFEGDAMWLAGTAGAVLTTLVLFLPSFVWIFAGAPFVERLQQQRRLSGALSAITATVVGVIANLAVWFAVSYLFAESVTVERLGAQLLLPQWQTLDLWALVLVGVAAALLLWWRLGVLPVLGLIAVAGALIGYWS